MTGIAYCVKYHIDNLACEISKINFSPVTDTKDREGDKNRRAKLYVYFAKKYLPKVLGIGRDEIEVRGENTGNVSVMIPYVGGGGTIGGNEEEDPMDRVEESIRSLASRLSSFDNIPDAYVRELSSELYSKASDGEISDDEIYINERDARDLNTVFGFLDFVGEDWRYLKDYFGEYPAFELMDKATSMSPNQMIDDLLYTYGIGKSEIIDVVTNGEYINDSVVEVINRLISEDPGLVTGDERLVKKLLEHIKLHKDDEDWTDIEWDKIREIEDYFGDILPDLFDDEEQAKAFTNYLGFGDDISGEMDNEALQDKIWVAVKKGMDDIGLFNGLKNNLGPNTFSDAIKFNAEELKKNIINSTKQNSMKYGGSDVPLSQLLKKRMSMLPYMSNSVPKEFRYAVQGIVDRLYNQIISDVESEENPEDIDKWKYKNSKRQVDDRVDVMDSYKPKIGIKFKSLWIE